MNDARSALADVRIVAKNLATASENRIHADDVARSLGFSGGLVPGVTTYGYLLRPVIAALGLDFVARGRATVRLLTPIYEGDEIVARGRRVEAEAGVVAYDLEVVDAKTGESRAKGSAAMGGASRSRPDPALWPKRPLPSPPRVAERAALEAEPVLGALEFTFDGGAPLPLEIDDDLGPYRAAGVAHPVLLLGAANFAFAANVALGPWIHVSSEIESLDFLRTGDALSIRGRVTSLHEKKGREYADLDLLYVVAGDRPILHVRHTAIYRFGTHLP